MRHCNVIGCALFQFTHPGKGATVWCCRSADRYLVSIHAPWEGCDPSPWRDLAYTPFGFNSRTLGRVRHTRDFCQASSICFNSRTLGRVRLEFSNLYCQLQKVTIHAPWEGCDTINCILSSKDTSFNSRTLGRVRRTRQLQAHRCHTFQFTHPGKGATRDIAP